MEGLSGIEIEKFIRNHGGKDMQKEFLCVYAADELKDIEKKKI